MKSKCGERQSKERWYVTRDQAVADFGIFDEDLVLDVGCGPDPNSPEIHDVRDTTFQRADVFVDGSSDLVRVYRTSGLRFCVGDAQALPFSNKTFDFVWSSHLLEHVKDPGSACQEIARVGERGRIRTPSKLKELVRPNDNHRWMVTALKKRLLFERKPEYLFTPFWRKAVYTKEMQAFLELTSKNQENRGKLLEIVFDWWDDFEVEVR